MHVCHLTTSDGTDRDIACHDPFEKLDQLRRLMFGDVAPDPKFNAVIYRLLRERSNGHNRTT